jgi:hypothetical protein
MPDAGSRPRTHPTWPRRSPTLSAYQGRKRVHNADEIMAEIVAKRLVEHLERAGFVVMKRPAIGGGGPFQARGNAGFFQQ